MSRSKKETDSAATGAADDVDQDANEPTEEPTHGVALACGCLAQLPNTISSKHHCTEHDVTVPVRSVFELA